MPSSVQLLLSRHVRLTCLGPGPLLALCAADDAADVVNNARVRRLSARRSRPRKHSRGVLQKVCASIYVLCVHCRFAHASHCSLIFAVSALDGCGGMVDAMRDRTAEVNVAGRDTFGAGVAAGSTPSADVERIRRSAVVRDFLLKASGSCRARSHAYMQAVNELQTADPYDPFLHREWALLLQTRGGRDAEAAQHMAMAFAMFQQAAMMSASGQRLAGPELPPALGSVGADGRVVLDARAAETWHRETLDTLALLPAEYRTKMLGSQSRAERNDDDDDDGEL